MNSLECLGTESIKLLENNNLLIPLIKKEIIKDKLNSVNIDSKEQEIYLEKVWEKHNIKNELEYEQWLNRQKINKKSFQEKILYEHKVKKHLNKEFANKIEKRFLEKKSSLDQVVYSLIRMKEPFKSREIFHRIVNNEANFGEMATLYSEGIEKHTRGLIGPSPLSKAHPQVANLLKSLSPQEIKEPFFLNGFTIIIRLESFLPATLDTKTRQMIALEMFEEELSPNIKSIHSKLIGSEYNKELSSINK
tara:strand:- start:1175 stop:1921 length:747 start_codon:yes stop_codon:yes gene_type:complete